MTAHADNRFSPDDLDRLRRETFVGAIDYHPQLGSTNDRALELAGDLDSEFPLLVLTESQTAGRGRGSNQWWASEGALTFSIMLATDVATLPTERWPQVSLTVGLAISEALESLLARGVPPTSQTTLPPVQLKWPNDVYVEGRKICGVLVEVPRTKKKRLLVGIGINVNNSLATAPDELQQRATSLLDLTGRPLPLTDVLVEVLKRLEQRLNPTKLWNAEAAAGWRKRCFLTDKTLRIDNGTRQSTGTCAGIDDQGALLLNVNDQQEKHLAGVITLL